MKPFDTVRHNTPQRIITPMHRIATAALTALLFPPSLAFVAACRLLEFDELDFDLDPFDVDLQLLQRSDDALA